MSGEEEPPPLRERVGWFVVLWVAGVAVIGAIAALIRFFLAV